MRARVHVGNKEENALDRWVVHYPLSMATGAAALLLWSASTHRTLTGSQRGHFKRSISVRSRNIVISQAKKNGEKKGGISFGDQLLDYIEGGPKLRKWYGAPDQLPVDRGGRVLEQAEEEPVGEEVVRDAILVTDADSDTGQLVVLSAILQRLRVRALVKDAKAATAAFGPYVEPIAGDVSSVSAVDEALRGVRAVICTNKVGVVAERAKVMAVEHVVLLSQAGLSSGEGANPFEALLGGGGRKQALRNEGLVASCGVPYTVVRAGKLRDEPGGGGVCFSQGDSARGSISREDAAEVCVRALEAPPQGALVFEVRQRMHAGVEACKRLFYQEASTVDKVVNGEGFTADWAESLGRLQESLVTL